MASNGEESSFVTFSVTKDRNTPGKDHSSYTLLVIHDKKFQKMSCDDIIFHAPFRPLSRDTAHKF